MNFSEENDYVGILRHFITSNAATRAYQSLLAKAANCHLSHISHVLNGRAHISLEQAIALCEFWQLDDLDTDYFLNLVNLARAGTPRLREKFKKEREKIRLNYMRKTGGVEENKRTVELSSEQSKYFLSAWFISAIHAALRFPEFQTLESLKTRFGLENDKIESVLQKLQQYDLIRIEDGRYVQSNVLVLGRVSDETDKNFHGLIRARANHAFDRGLEHDLFKTLVLNVSRPQIPVFRARLESVLRSILEDTKKTNENGDIAFLNVDFFVS